MHKSMEKAARAMAVLGGFVLAILIVLTCVSVLGRSLNGMFHGWIGELDADFVGKLQDSIDAGVGNLVDADLAKESAKLQSLQTKQQLGIQALSIANQSSGTVLSLFR